MKCVLVVLCGAVLVLGQEVPRGAFLVLPEQAVFPGLRQQESLEEVSRRASDRLRQEAGSQAGDYHLYQGDGRLQSVRYVAAPLRPAVQQASQQSSVQSANGFSNANNVQVNLQSPFSGRARFQETPTRFQEAPARLQERQSGQREYIASVQFTDVPPIPAPIYAQGPQPLTRILRHLE